MEVNLKESRLITLFADESKNIVIFPYGKSSDMIDEKNGIYAYRVSYYPIELSFPFGEQELANKIQLGIDEYDKHPCYKTFSGRNTFEEKYYNIQGFKNAVKGKKRIHVGWNAINGKYAYLFIPFRTGYSYFGIEKKKLPIDAGWIDFARAVIELLELDLTQLPAYKIYKNKLNL